MSAFQLKKETNLLKRSIFFSRSEVTTQIIGLNFHIRKRNVISDEIAQSKTFDIRVFFFIEIDVFLFVFLEETIRLTMQNFFISKFFNI